MKYLMIVTLLLVSTPLTYAATAQPIVSGHNGERFTIQSVPGDGNCAFSAIGKTRKEVVDALTAMVEAHDEAYRSFSQARQSLLQTLKDLTNESSSETMMEILIHVRLFLTESTPESKQALTEFQDGIGTFAAEAFNTAKQALMTHIENIYYEPYEAFYIALMNELHESGIKPDRVRSTLDLKKAIEAVFAHNSTRRSWLPMGLIFSIHEQLGLNLAIWSSRGESSGKVRLYQFTAPDGNLWDASVRHVIWSGNHFNVLIPANP